MGVGAVSESSASFGNSIGLPFPALIQGRCLVLICNLMFHVSLYPREACPLLNRNEGGQDGGGEGGKEGLGREEGEETVVGM